MSVSRVLLAEDDPLVAAVLGPFLEDLGLEVVGVKNGTDAVALLETQRFDAVVSDMKMPGTNGVDVLAAARKSGILRLVLVSGYADDTTRDQIEALGGVLLHKPFGAEDLRQAVLGHTA